MKDTPAASTQTVFKPKRRLEESEGLRNKVSKLYLHMMLNGNKTRGTKAGSSAPGRLLVLRAPAVLLVCILTVQQHGRLEAEIHAGRKLSRYKIS